MLFPAAGHVLDVSLLLLRLLIALVFGTSGWSHLTRPAERGESIGISPGATAILGGIEVAAALSVALGLFAQLGALLLTLVMLGAIHRKMRVWKTGLWGEGGGGGWYYDLLYLACCLVIFATDGGALALT